MYVNNRACRPGVPLVDGIAVPIDLQRTIEVRPGLDRAFAIILDLAAPENHLAFFICGLLSMCGWNCKPQMKITWPFLFFACSSSPTFKASPLPPGKKGPTLPV